MTKCFRREEGRLVSVSVRFDHGDSVSFAVHAEPWPSHLAPPTVKPTPIESERLGTLRASDSVADHHWINQTAWDAALRCAALIEFYLPQPYLDHHPLPRIVLVRDGKSYAASLEDPSLELPSPGRQSRWSSVSASPSASLGTRIHPPGPEPASSEAASLPHLTQPAPRTLLTTLSSLPAVSSRPSADPAVRPDLSAARPRSSPRTRTRAPRPAAPRVGLTCACAPGPPLDRTHRELSVLAPSSWSFSGRVLMLYSGPPPTTCFPFQDVPVTRPSGEPPGESDMTWDEALSCLTQVRQSETTWIPIRPQQGAATDDSWLVLEPGGSPVRGARPTTDWYRSVMRIESNSPDPPVFEAVLVSDEERKAAKTGRGFISYDRKPDNDAAAGEWDNVVHAAGLRELNHVLPRLFLYGRYRLDGSGRPLYCVPPRDPTPSIAPPDPARSIPPERPPATRSPPTLLTADTHRSAPSPSELPSPTRDDRSPDPTSTTTMGPSSQSPETPLSPLIVRSQPPSSADHLRPDTVPLSPRLSTRPSPQGTVASQSCLVPSLISPALC